MVIWCSSSSNYTRYGSNQPISVRSIKGDFSSLLDCSLTSEAGDITFQGTPTVYLSLNSTSFSSTTAQFRGLHYSKVFESCVYCFSRTSTRLLEPTLRRVCLQLLLSELLLDPGLPAKSNGQVQSSLTCPLARTGFFSPPIIYFMCLLKQSLLLHLASSASSSAGSSTFFFLRKNSTSQC